MELAGPQPSWSETTPAGTWAFLSVPPPRLFRKKKKKKAHEILSFHRPCQTQALTCSPRMLTIPALDAELRSPALPQAQLPQDIFPAASAAATRPPPMPPMPVVRTTPTSTQPGCPEGWAFAPRKGAQTHLHLSSFILLEHEAEDVIVRPGEQAQVERAIGNREFLEEHCKAREGPGGASRKRGSGTQCRWDRRGNADTGRS